jgi:cytochrome P450
MRYGPVRIWENGRREAEFIRETQKSAYFPFGEGPRKCIGYRFAMMEIAILYSVILQRYAWTMAPGYVPEKDITKSLLLPKSGLPVTLKRLEVGELRS